MTTASGAAMALHGGAGAQRSRDYAREIAHMEGLVEAARDQLSRGASALEVVVETTAALEVSGLSVAGRGASPNRDGCYESDASVMDGPSRRAGAVAAPEGFESPISVARDAAGEIAMPFVSEGVKRAALHPDGRIEAAAF